jgi:hypothetical protein
VSESSDIVSPEAVSSTIFIGLANARMRGDPWKPLAEEHLGDVEVLLKRSKKLAMETVRLFATAATKVDGLDKKLLALFEKLTESLWEVRGRMHQDPLLSVLTPGTPSFFFEWPIGHSFDRFDAVLGFISTCVSADGPEHAAIVEIQVLLPEYHAACETARALLAKINVFEKMTESFARLGHVQYSRLRRRMQADGFDSAEIRNVFPDIPGKRGTSTLA